MKCRPIKCPCCQQRFRPQPHNAYHQNYCPAKECQAASHRRSQRLWFWYNPDHFKKDDHSSTQKIRREYARPRSVSYRTPPRIRVEFQRRGRHRGCWRVRISQPLTGVQHDVYLRQAALRDGVVKGLVDILQERMGSTRRICIA